MKKSVLILMMLIGCLMLGSCAVSADQMLQEFNEQVYEELGNGNYVGKGVHISTKLIPRDVYPVKEAYTLRLEIDPRFYDYQWSVKDNTSGSSYNIPGYYIVYVGRPEIDFIYGHSYTLTLFAKNRNGVLFTDTATLSVVK